MEQGKLLLDTIVGDPIHHVMAFGSESMISIIDAEERMVTELGLEREEVRTRCPDSACAARVDGWRNDISESQVVVIAMGVLCEKAGMCGSLCPDGMIDSLSKV